LGYSQITSSFDPFFTRFTGPSGIFYLAHLVGVSSVMGQNKLYCDWSTWLWLGDEQDPKKGS